MPYKEPTNRIERRALDEIETIKARREQRALKSMQDAQRKKAKEDKKIREAQQELQRRKIQLGGARNPADDAQLVLYSERTTEPSQQPRLGMAEGVQLLDLETEEEEEA